MWGNEPILKKYERTFVINRVILSYNPQNFSPLSECMDISQLIYHKKGISKGCLELYQTSWGRSALKNGRQAEIPPFQGEKGPGFICARRVVIPSIDYPTTPYGTCCRQMERRHLGSDACSVRQLCA